MLSSVHSLVNLFHRINLLDHESRDVFQPLHSAAVYTQREERRTMGVLENLKMHCYSQVKTGTRE